VIWYIGQENEVSLTPGMDREERRDESRIHLEPYHLFVLSKCRETTIEKNVAVEKSVKIYLSSMQMLDQDEINSETDRLSRVGTSHPNGEANH
jgi:hypothetical protein